MVVPIAPCRDHLDFPLTQAVFWTAYCRFTRPQQFRPMVMLTTALTEVANFPVDGSNF
jgi:hypothetical protein